MKCRECKFLSEPVTFGDQYPSVRCTLGLWDKESHSHHAKPLWQWYSFGECMLNRGPVRRLGEACTQGEKR